MVDSLDAVAAETGKNVPQVALNCLLQPRGRSRALPGGARAREGMGTRRGFPSKRPTVASVIIGARDEAQLRDNLGAVRWNLTAAQVARLDAASATTPIYPYWHQWQFKERNPTPVG